MQDVQSGPRQAVKMGHKGHQVPLPHELLARMGRHHYPCVESKLRFDTKMFVWCRVDVLVLIDSVHVSLQTRVQVVRCAHNHEGLEQLPTTRACQESVRK